MRVGCDIPEQQEAQPLGQGELVDRSELERPLHLATDGDAISDIDDLRCGGVRACLKLGDVRSLMPAMRAPSTSRQARVGFTLRLRSVKNLLLGGIIPRSLPEVDQSSGLGDVLQSWGVRMVLVSCSTASCPSRGTLGSQCPLLLQGGDT